MASNLVLLLILCCGLIRCNALRKELPFGFSFDRFSKNVSLEAEISVHGDAQISDDVVRLTKPMSSSVGFMVYREPFKFLGTKPGFSAYVCFSVSSGNGGWLSFFLVPSSVRMESAGIISSAISVELFYPNSANGSEKLIVNQVKISVGRHVILKKCNVSATKLLAKDGEQWHSWIDYDGTLKRIEVRFSTSKDVKPTNSSVSVSIDLSSILLRETMLAGLSSSNGNYNQSCSVYSWSFSIVHGGPFPMHSEPLDPKAFPVGSFTASPPVHGEGANYCWRMLIAISIAAAFGALLTFFVMIIWIKLVNRLPMASVECPVHPVDFVDEKIYSAEDKDAECEMKTQHPRLE